MNRKRERDKEIERKRQMNEFNDATHFYCIFLYMHELKIRVIKENKKSIEICQYTSGPMTTN